MKLADTQWSPAWKRWHARRFPSTWGNIKDRLPDPEPPRPAQSPLLLTCKPPPREAARIIQLCAAAATIEVGLIIFRSRAEDAVNARKAAAYLIRKHCGHTYTMIGQRLGGRPPQMAMNACEQVEDDLAQNGARFGWIVAHVEEHL